MRRLDEELTEELDFHRDIEIAAAMRAGMDEQSARQHARRKPGGSADIIAGMTSKSTRSRHCAIQASGRLTPQE